MLRSTLVLCTILVAAHATVIDHQAIGRAAAQANREALRELLADSSAPLIIGQNIGHGGQAAAGYQEFFDAGRLDGRLPQLCGVDYGWDHMDPVGIAQANQALIAHWRRGGLVTISAHPANPSTGGGVREPEGIRIDQVLTPGTDDHTAWMADLAAIGDGLTELEAAGVAVIWRPLHEANGAWFWWGHEQIPDAAYKRLWGHMYRYLVQDRGLENLLWLYAADGNGDAASPMKRYPGNECVDAVALDLYLGEASAEAFNRHRSYDLLIATGKPFGIAEFGPVRAGRGEFDAQTMFTALQRHCPRARWCLWWHSWTGSGWLGSRQRMSLVDNPGAAALLARPDTRTLNATVPQP